MANVIQIKRSNTTATPTGLAAGELANSEVSDKLFIGLIGGGEEIVGGKYFTDLLDHTTGVLTASSAVIVDASSKVDNFKVDNLDFNGNTISSTDTNGNIIISPNGNGVVDVDSSRVTGLSSPTQASDATTKAYVDALVTGLDVKNSVRVLSDADIDLSVAADPSPVDGVTLANGDRILLTGQTAGAENGIYDAVTATDPTTWVRSSDADTDAEVNAGMFTFVEEGTNYADGGWVLTTNDPITLDTTSLSFSQFSGAGSIVAGAGLTKTGNTLDVGGTTDRITVNANSVDIAATYAGQSSIVTLGTVTTGVWSGTIITLAKGGTGADLSGAASGTIFKTNGSIFVAATAGTDYLNSTSTIDGGTF